MIYFIFVHVLVLVCCGFALSWYQGRNASFAFDNIYHESSSKRPSTGFYASPPDRVILMYGGFFGDGPGGVEALIQLSIALSEAVSDRNQLFVTNTNYHQKWEAHYGPNLIRYQKSLVSLKKDDIYIVSEGMGCQPEIPEGVIVFVYVLASYLGCHEKGIRFIAHNFHLANFQGLRLPRERVIHPYVSEHIIERAMNRAGLQHDGSISYQRSQLKTTKKKLVLIDNDLPEFVYRVIKKASEDAGGSYIILNELEASQLEEVYDQGMIMVDWCMRGSERCPLEAALYGAIAVTNNCDTGMDFSDFPIHGNYTLSGALQAKEKTEDNVEFNEIMVSLFKHIFEHYWEIVQDFEPLRRSILSHSPLSMTKETMHFLATVDIDENTPDGGHLLPGRGGCKGCRHLRR